VSFRFQFRRGTTAERDASNPILAAGEPAVVLDSGQPAELVLGDGVAAMADLRRAVWGDDTRLALASTATQPGDLGTAAAEDVGDFATAAQGAKADTAVQQAGSKGGGQNVHNLRRPTLVVDKMFPSAFHDHQIVHVDEPGKFAYSIGQDRRLRKASWSAAGDEAITFGPRKSSSPDGSSWAADGVFIRSTTGALLMEQRDLGLTTNTVLLRSTAASDGAAWTTVLTLPANKRFLGPQSVCQDLTTGYFYAVEYLTGAVETVANVWRSTDDGATWAVFKAMPRSETDVAGKIRHWHSTRYDSVSQRVYFTAGDTSADAGIYRVNAGGTDIEAVLLNSQVDTAEPGARAVDLMFFPTHIVWAVDGGDPHVRRMARNQIGTPSPTTERGVTINSTGWWTQKAAADGTLWVFSTSTEPIAEAIDTASHLYAVSENGAQVDEVAAVVMDGNVLGYSSLSGLGGGSGGGDSFWLRAHNYQQFPNVTYSAFQLRAKVVWGATQIIKPANRAKEYVREGRNTLQALTASQTLTFGHTRAPFRACRLQILNMGSKILTGGGAVKLQVWNVTSSTELMGFAGGQSWRTDSTTDTQEVYDSILCGAGDQIEFRLVETSGSGTPTVTSFIEFGWTF